ncbi:SAVMC3_10250 family protein [Streptomyces sp. NPDC002276]
MPGGCSRPAVCSVAFVSAADRARRNRGGPCVRVRAEALRTARSSSHQFSAGGQRIGRVSPGAPVLEVSGSRSLSDEPHARATLAELAKGVKEVEDRQNPAQFTDFGLRPNRWIHFDLDMTHAAVHEDDGEPPEDVVLFVGDIAAGSRGQPRDMGLLLCGSVQHLRTRAVAAGRMGSDTTWLHDLVLGLERRDQEGHQVTPESPTYGAPSRRRDQRREEAAMGVFFWVSRDYPANCRSRMRGHAVVLMDIEDSSWSERLVVASPLHVEALPPSSGRRRRPRAPWSWRRRAPS